MLNVGSVSWTVWLPTGLAALTALYVIFVYARVWRDHKRSRANGRSSAAGAPSLDAHIAQQWTDGRHRLDSLLTLLRALELALERDVHSLAQLDPADPRHAGEARSKIDPVLRRFTFDTHLRDECRMLLPLLQFCGKDLAALQGMNTAAQLQALADIQVALAPGARG